MPPSLRAEHRALGTRAYRPTYRRAGRLILSPPLSSSPEALAIALTTGSESPQPFPTAAPRRLVQHTDPADKFVAFQRRHAAYQNELAERPLPQALLPLPDHRMRPLLVGCTLLHYYPQQCCQVDLAIRVPAGADGFSRRLKITATSSPVLHPDTSRPSAGSPSNSTTPMPPAPTIIITAEPEAVSDAAAAAPSSYAPRGPRQMSRARLLTSPERHPIQIDNLRSA
ncbi:uncharacterized protein B0H18DRAFT_1119601 [Fomitopsis serialis]|uniref:uncharacterized protein n=1 Tax=Fomitopsis serialis TaxID=139415 RepID=UPI002008AE42|nr:uncharacterized protein B0H18DRAFT_1119601 [Neoantrodia serialis]KAH9925171.1 hypothetical protein B0H18DRAFT_1119601 [Neoantrodia serialis]